jgi:hypothetical protein
VTSPASADDALFGDVLACEELRPLAFVPGRDADPAAVAAAAEALLRALAVVEDGPRGDEPEPGGDHALPRIEAKIDLLTALVASLCAQAGADPSRRLRWSARGACIDVADAPVAGTRGYLRVRPADWLPSPLQLPATVLATAAQDEGHRAWLRFDDLPAPLQAALERHLFRQHRRAVAESRRPRTDI